MTQGTLRPRNKTLVAGVLGSAVAATMAMPLYFVLLDEKAGAELDRPFLASYVDPPASVKPEHALPPSLPERESPTAQEVPEMPATLPPPLAPEVELSRAKVTAMRKLSRDQLQHIAADPHEDRFERATAVSSLWACGEEEWLRDLARTRPDDPLLQAQVRSLGSTGRR